VLAVLGMIVLGASQYLFLAYAAYDPRTAYSEYMPRPPEPMELLHYGLGTYFSDLYGSGLDSPRNLLMLQSALRSAHPWLSLPLMAGGLVLLAAGWRRRDPAWFGLALLLGAGLSFVPFVLWYGAYDIRAFHGPVLGPLLVVSVATLGWWLRRSPGLRQLVAGILIAVGLIRAAHTGWLLSFREPEFHGVAGVVSRLVDQAPTQSPVVAMSYGLRMATLYEELRGEVPGSARYRVHWRAISETLDGGRVSGIVVPTDGRQFVAWILHYRPELECQTWDARQPAGARWPAYVFDCRVP
jgi:hypothetical protein